jgi:polyribonucleotide nucleotidyltransferase
VAGRVEDDGEVAILMIEAEATPNAWVHVEMGATAPTEELVGEAIAAVKPLIKQLCEAQQEFIDQVGVRDAGEFPVFLDYTEPVFELADEFATARVEEVYRTSDLGKAEKDASLDVIRQELVEHVVANGPADLDDEERLKQAKNAFRSIEKKAVRRLIVNDGIRVDGRGVSDIRDLSAEVQVLPRTHGSALFQRGETQALSVLALGTPREAQRIDTLDPIDEKRYLHHYNFPPYSTGETGRVGSPKRREIGHGMLAERAIVPVLPGEDEWPYTIRIVSDILSSNGSTSMASVCGSTLALMDGGVPIHAPVAGIAMGLVFEDGKYTTLTDIQGVEDFFGDMDFKVAGPKEFITALQLDTKLAGLPSDVLRDALLQAKDARLQILDVMREAIAEPRPEVAETAPRVEVVHIPQDKIGDIIGPRGKIIKEITEETGAQIDVEEEAGRGVVRIYADTKEIGQAALDKVNAIANPTLPEAGERYHATVVKTVDFGAFVSLTPGIDGLLHISEMSKMVGRRLEHGEEAAEVGQQILVEIKEVLDGGRKFKLAYVGDEPTDDAGDKADKADKPEKAEKAEVVDVERDEPRGGARQRGGRDRGGDREGRGERGGGERGGRDRGGDREGGGERGGGERGGGERGGRDRGGERTRTRTRSRSRDRG